MLKPSWLVLGHPPGGWNLGDPAVPDAWSNAKDKQGAKSLSSGV